MLKNAGAAELRFNVMQADENSLARGRGKRSRRLRHETTTETCLARARCRFGRVIAAALAVLSAGWGSVAADDKAVDTAGVVEAGRRLVAAYPELLSHVEGETLVWRDGTRMPLDDGLGHKSPEAWLATPDLSDMLSPPYATGPLDTPPDGDPGRARNAAFFERMYGDCRSGAVNDRLTELVWLPKRGGTRLKVTRVNGVAERLAAISRELDELPASFDRFLMPPAGTYNCRVIAGTSRVSAHGYGIAIDIAAGTSDYWRWAAGGALPSEARPAAWRNRIPTEIVAVFERHGFIWGGKWRHFDTMHFEYRPELLPPLAPLAPKPSVGEVR